MHGARLVNTPATKRIGNAVSGLDDSWAEICEKSTGAYLEWATTHSIMSLTQPLAGRSPSQPLPPVETNRP